MPTNDARQVELNALPAGEAEERFGTVLGYEHCAVSAAPTVAKRMLQEYPEAELIEVVDEAAGEILATYTRDM